MPWLAYTISKCHCLFCLSEIRVTLSVVETTNFYIDKLSHRNSKTIHEQNMMERGNNDRN